MKKYRLNSGYDMPLLGLGSWKALDERQLYSIIREAINTGYRHFDCAKIYGNETIIGSALKDAFNDRDVKREEIFVTSKLWNDSHAKQDVIPALESTLWSLWLDYLDLYLIHWPVCFKKGVDFPKTPDEFIPLEELPVSQTWSEMEKTVTAGLTRSIGVSNFSIKKLDGIYSNSSIKPAVNQVESHPFLQQKALLEYCNSKNIAFTAYSPLGSKDRPDALRAKGEVPVLENPVIVKIAHKHNVTPAQVLIKWQIQRNVVVIPKTTNLNRLKENFAAQFIELDDSDMQEIASLDQHFRYLTGEFFTPTGSGYTIENLWDE